MISSQNDFTIIPALIGFLLALTWLISRFDFFRKYASHIKEMDHKEVILPSFAIIVSPFLFTYMFWGDSCGVIKSTIPFVIFFIGVNYRNKQRLDSIKAEVNQSLRIIKRKIGLNRQYINENYGLLEAESKVKSNDEDYCFAEGYFRLLLPLEEDFIKIDTLKEIANEGEVKKVDHIIEREQLFILWEITMLINEINQVVELRNAIVFSPTNNKDGLEKNNIKKIRICTQEFLRFSQDFIEIVNKLKDVNI